MIETTIKQGKLMFGAVLAALTVGAHGVHGQTVPAAPTATFRSSVDLVRVAAIVRDHKGRFVQDLTVRDFEVTDGGQPRPITDFRQDLAGVSVALLFDASGSMEGLFGRAREAATHVLSWLDATQDEAAVFRFDTRLEETTPFTTGLRALPPAQPSGPAAGWRIPRRHNARPKPPAGLRCSCARLRPAPPARGRRAGGRGCR